MPSTFQPLIPVVDYWRLLKSFLEVKKECFDWDDDSNLTEKELTRYKVPGRLLSLTVIQINHASWLTLQVNAANAAFLAGRTDLEYPVDILYFDSHCYIGIEIGNIVAPYNKLPTLDYLTQLLKYYSNYAITQGEYVPMEYDEKRKYY